MMSSQTMFSTERRGRKHILSSSSSSAETVAANDDLFTEILLRLPVRSLLKFKSVSKHWLSLITIPHFTRRINPKPNPSALFLHRSSFLLNPEFDFVPLENPAAKPPFRALTFSRDPSGIKILQSYHGLLLCCSFVRKLPSDYPSNCYIYNPTTNRFSTLPHATTARPYAFNLAFDPSKSPHYEVICVCFSDAVPEHFELEIYSSETGLWKPSGKPFPAEVNFKISVFWNGALHWICTWDADSLYFNVDQELLGTMPMPAIPEGYEGRRLRFFGESRGHLHLIEIYGPKTSQFDVYEMERGYSAWFVKYRVDLDAIPNEFPDMICGTLDPSDLHCYGFVILGLVRAANEEDSFLVLHIPGKAIRYKFLDKSFEKIFDVPLDIESPGFEGCLKFGWFDAFEFIESLADV